MAMRMLIDARHPEETRVAVLNGNRIEEFDFESAEHKQIKGNIYLAKVTRVEPSLQAAFVDFGGNRHGFLAFSEIHPDYYQIPSQDRAALIAEEQAHAEEEAALREEEEDEDEAAGRPGRDDGFDEGDGVEEIDTSEIDEVATIEDGLVELDPEAATDDEGVEDEEPYEADEADEADETAEGAPQEEGAERRNGRRGRNRRQGAGERGGERDRGGERGERSPNRARAKEIDELRAKRQALRRRYKIQDVIQRRQVLLVQVVKEERGNKGAALTTYLSLAGRYCVLMPNSSHGGGISRKISSGADRKRLKQIVGELTLPRSMGLIVRTAGLQRTKTEIKRDFDYLARLWDEIRETTLASSAPAAIHSDSDLVKRAIRDIYNRDIEEVVVEGEEGYRAARQFMKLLMPSHATRVKAYSDPVPLFQRYGAEDQLSAMYDPVVQLKSGGYLVINPTEALVSIDINSGRSTKEHGIEATALNTNLEAAREIARQLRLRDMAGLVVIDFIDMENSSSIRKVEKAMKEALKNDRARIQVGRISSFGLMEMSRQRLRTGVLEATTRTCPHCDGTGLVRTASSAGLSALRLIEDEAAKGKGSIITLFASTEAAIYMLNAKRADLAEIEARYHVSVEVVPEGEEEGAKMRIQSSGPRPIEPPTFAPIVIDDEDEVDELPEEEEDEEEFDEVEEEEASAAEPRAPARSAEESEDDAQRKKRRRRRRGGRGRNRLRDEGEGSSEEGTSDEAAEAMDEEAEGEAGAGAGSEQDVEDVRSEEGGEEIAAAPEADAEERPARGRRRRGRGRRAAAEEATSDEIEPALPLDESSPAEVAVSDQPLDAAPPEEASEQPAEEFVAAPDAGPKAEAAAETVAPDAEAAPELEAVPEAEAAPKPRRTSRRKPGAKAPEQQPEAADATPKPRGRRRKAEPAPQEADVAGEAGDGAGESEVASEEPKPARTRRRAKPADDAIAVSPAPAKPVENAEAAGSGELAPAQIDTNPADTSLADDAESGADGAEDNGSPRRGWWQRTFGA